MLVSGAAHTPIYCMSLNRVSRHSCIMYIHMCVQPCRKQVMVYLKVFNASALSARVSAFSHAARAAFSSRSNLARAYMYSNIHGCMYATCFSICIYMHTTHITLELVRVCIYLFVYIKLACLKSLQVSISCVFVYMSSTHTCTGIHTSSTSVHGICKSPVCVGVLTGVQDPVYNLLLGRWSYINP